MADEQQTQPPDSGDAPPGFAARLRGMFAWLAEKARGGVRPLYRFRRIILLSGCGLFVLASALATLRYVQLAREHALSQGLTIAAALEQLDAGEYAEARRIAKLLPRAKQLNHEELGEVHFIIGAAIANETDNAWDEPNRVQFYALAARHLQQADQRRFPPGREAEGRLLLGRCLIEAGRFEQAIAPLLKIDAGAPALEAESQRLLARAHLKSMPPDLKRAAQHARAYTQSAKHSAQARDRAALLQSEIALAQGELDASDTLLAQVPDESDLVHERRMLRGQWMMAKVKRLASRAGEDDATANREAIDKLYEQAIALLRQGQSHHASGQGLSSKASYMIGIALKQQGQLEAAQEQFFRTRKRYYNSPEVVASALEETSVLIELGRFDEAGAALQIAASHVASGGRFSNPYVSEKQLRERVEQGFETFYANQRYDLAVNLSQILAPLVGKSKATQLHAQSLERWGELSAHQAQAKTGQDAEQLYRISRKKHRLAGYAYASLAQQRYVTREYPLDLWRSGHNFNQGRDYESAVVMLNEYLTTEATTERPLVLMALADAYLSLNQVDQAITAIDDCLRDFSRDPAIYRARLLASDAYVENGNRRRAVEFLRANLHHESLTPRSDAWRDSLFALGMVLHDEGRAMLSQPADAASSDPADGGGQSPLEQGHRLLHDGIRSLSEAVARYPDADQALSARYAIAEAYRHGSRVALERLQRETIESRRAALNRQIHDELTSSLEQYDRLIALMNEKSHQGGPLTENEQRILRNAYFARGTILYDLGSFDDAIKAYSTATSRYQHEPAAIEAYVQIAACYRRLNKPLEARGTLEQAKLVMQRIRPEADFTNTTRFDREEWSTLLNWMSSL